MASSPSQHLRHRGVFTFPACTASYGGVCVLHSWPHLGPMPRHCGMVTVWCGMTCCTACLFGLHEHCVRFVLRCSLMSHLFCALRLCYHLVSYYVVSRHLASPCVFVLCLSRIVWCSVQLSSSLVLVCVSHDAMWVHLWSHLVSRHSAVWCGVVLCYVVSSYFVRSGPVVLS